MKDNEIAEHVRTKYADILATLQSFPERPATVEFVRCGLTGAAWLFIRTRKCVKRGTWVSLRLEHQLVPDKSEVTDDALKLLNPGVKALAKKFHSVNETTIIQTWHER